jgi:hypothetical protein
MLQMFRLDVLKVDLGVAHVAMAIHAYFKCFICFRHMLQMFHLDIAKVDLMLHMLLWLYTYVSSVSSISDVCCKCFIWMFEKLISGEHMLQWRRWLTDSGQLQLHCCGC